MPDGSLQLVGAMTKQNDPLRRLARGRDEPVGTFSVEGVAVDETTIDVKLDVVYADNAAEVTDQDAFERLLTGWKSEVLAMKKTNLKSSNRYPHWLLES